MEGGGFMGRRVSGGIGVEIKRVMGLGNENDWILFCTGITLWNTENKCITKMYFYSLFFEFAIFSLTSFLDARIFLANIEII